MELDVSNYSVDELFHSLESVDDIQFPEQALLILKSLLNKSGLNVTQIQDAFKSETSLELIGNLPVLSAIASDVVNSNHEVTDKLKRLLVKL
jgi:hypothetical protein